MKNIIGIAAHKIIAFGNIKACLPCGTASAVYFAGNQNEIRFPDFLRIQEDSYFNGLAASFAEKKSYVPVTSYVWKYNPDSTTRKNGGIYAYESIPDFIRSCSMVHKIIEKKNPEQME